MKSIITALGISIGIILGAVITIGIKRRRRRPTTTTPEAGPSDICIIEMGVLVPADEETNNENENLTNPVQPEHDPNNKRYKVELYLGQNDKPQP